MYSGYRICWAHKNNEPLSPNHNNKLFCAIGSSIMQPRCSLPYTIWTGGSRIELELGLFLAGQMRMISTYRWDDKDTKKVDQASP